MIIIASTLSLVDEDEEGYPFTYPVIGWHNLVTADNIASTTAEDANPAINLANPATHLKWVGVVDSPTADEYITVQPGTADEIDYIAIAAHNFGTGGIPISIEGLTALDSPGDWDELIAPQTVPNDGPLIFRFEPQILEAIRIRLQPGDEAPQAAVVYVGRLLVFQRGVQGDYTPLPYGRVANQVTGRSESGNFLGRIVTNTRTESAASFMGLTPEWVRETLNPFLLVTPVQPFFFAWNPEDFPLEVGYAWMTNDPQPLFDEGGWTAIDFTMTGIV